MNGRTLKACLGVAVVVGVLGLSPLHAEEPTPGALAAAKEYIILKGGAVLYESVVPGVIEQAKTKEKSHD